MTTRAGTPYQDQQTQASTSASMDFSPESLKRTLTEQFRHTLTEQFRQLSGRLDQIEHRMGTLEESHMSQLDITPPRPTPVHIPRAQYPDPIPNPNPRRPTQDETEEDRAFRSVKFDAPTFDGNLDRKVYMDWESDMDQYFEWYEMSEERKVKFAKFKLVRQA